jgi:hypothetical protein
MEFLLNSMRFMVCFEVQILCFFLHSMLNVVLRQVSGKVFFIWKFKNMQLLKLYLQRKPTGLLKVILGASA